MTDDRTIEHSPGPPAPGLNSGAAMLGWMQAIAPFGIFTTDGELRIRSWNRWLESHSGLSARGVLGRPLLEVFPDLANRRLQNRFTRALNGEISVLSTALHQYLLPLRVSVPGNDLPYMLQTARIAPLSEDGTVTGTITIIEDVTQREVQAAILHRQQEHDRLLSSALGALLQSTDPAGDIPEIFATILPSLGLDTYAAYLADSAARRLSLSSSAGFTSKQRELLTEQPAPGSSDAGRDTSPDVDAMIEAHTQRLRLVGVRGNCCFPLAIGDRVIGLLSFGSYGRDVIASADAATLSRITRYVAVAIDRAGRERDAVAASQAKDDFLAALSHELRTPLNPVLLLASDSALNPEYSASAREAFRVIEKNALLEARLIDDLLDLTRIEHGKLSLELQRLDVHATLRDALGTIRAEASERGLSLQVALDSPTSVVMGDAGRLQQVFWNVLKNAVKFTPTGGSIRVSSRYASEAGEVEIHVTDTGIGMEPHEVKRIFGAFTQGDHAQPSQRHRFGGLGLGLAISHKLVELHSGRISASSPGAGQGATFIISLPAVSGHEAMAHRNSGSRPEASARSNGFSHGPEPEFLGNILLVEDHESTRIPLTQLLVRRGYEMVAVGTAAEARVAAAEHEFDLVLCDIGLPDGDGFTLMRELRERHGLTGIALTGYGMEQDVAHGVEAGFIRHLTKPISVALLDRTLKEAFAKKSAP